MPAAGLAKSSSSLKQEINRQRQKIRSQKKSIQKLSRQERKLHSNVARVEDELEGLQRKLQAQEKNSKQLDIQKKQAQQQYQRLLAQKQAQKKHLAQLLSKLWPLYLDHNFGKGKSSQTWAESDRSFSWMQEIYAQSADALRSLQQKSIQVTASLAEIDQLKEEIEVQAKSITALKNKLLGKKLSFLQQVQKIRARKLSREQELEQVLQVVEDLKYKLKVLTSHRLPNLKGYLPWPGKGQLKIGFKSRANPPHRGLSIALAPDSNIRCVSWGQVVHSAVLRGFGKVVIVYHGDDYYSLYAFLSQTKVHVGQKVEKDEVLGICGFYPRLKGTGLYFELRFHQKAINPISWLRSRT